MVQVLRLFQRHNAQFALEQILKRVVLAERVSPLAGLPIKAHEKAMDVLLKRVQNEKALTGLDGLLALASGDKALDQTGQRAKQEQKEPFPLKGKPLVKFGRVQDRKPREKVPLVEIKGLANLADAVGGG